MKGRKANTFYDNRYTDANKINNMKTTCEKGKPIIATQKGNLVTIKCECGLSSNESVGGIIDAFDVLTTFHDLHKEKQ